jgi:protein involved in polysaccharide export with SLBB domain
VAIYGQVKLPGEYPFSEKMGVLELLSIAGGIDDPTFLESMYLKKAQVVRRSFSEQYPKVILVDLEKAIEGIPEHNIGLENLDIIIVNQNPNYESPKRVDIMGEVNIPGVYTIQENGETLSDILGRAGGFTSKAFEDGIQMYRDSNQVVLQNYDIVVMNGDSLHVPQHPGIIYVKGEVYNPGLIQFKKGKNLRHYIESAGGFNIFADDARIAVFYANGDVKIKKWFSNPKIKEGATIVVYTREIREPVNWTEFAKNISSIIASFATIFILINQ